MVDTVRERTVVRAAPERIMAVIADFAAYPRWQDEVERAEVLETDDEGRGTLVRFVVDAHVRTVTYTLAYRHDRRAISWTLADSDLLRRNDGCYRLSDLGDGRTEVVYDLALSTTFSLPGLLRRRAAGRIVDNALRGLRRRVEEGA